LRTATKQCLQQFVNQSPWDERVVRANLARRMCAEIEPSVWVIDDTGFAKKGRWSVGVARQYPGTLGRVDSCQIGVSISAASDAASCPINWRIFLPEERTRTPSGAPGRTCPPTSATARVAAGAWT
jgi:SRSO17 transposase